MLRFLRTTVVEPAARLSTARYAVEPRATRALSNGDDVYCQGAQKEQ